MSSLTPALAALTLAGAMLAVVPASAGAAVPTCHGEPATIVGTDGADRLTGTPGPDVIVGRDGNDVVRGRGGDDVICGGAGADELHGNSGDDRLYGQRDAWKSDPGGAYLTPDLLDGGPGDDLLDTGGDDRGVAYGAHGILDFSHATSAVKVDLAAGTATGQGSDTLVLATLPCDSGVEYCFSTEVFGTRYDDTLLGSDTNDELYGAAGSDHLEGRGGADHLDGDHPVIDRTAALPRPVGDDVMIGGAGNDFLDSRGGRDHLFGDRGVDQLWALEGRPAEVRGGADHDTLNVVFPSRPGFVVDGGAGDDMLQFTSSYGRDADPLPPSATLTMADGSVVADGDTEWGQVLDVEQVGLGGPATWTYVGTDDADTIFGGPDKKLTATTYGGDDEIVGSGKADHIDVGEGHDVVDGEGGRDTCLHAEIVQSCEITD